MKVEQISTIVNSLVQQAIGEVGVSATDLTGLVATGNAVLSSAENTDAFVHTLLDRVGRVILSSRPYQRNRLNLLMNTFEYGCVMQKITVMPTEAEDAVQWELTNGQSVDQYVVKKPIVKQKLFDGLTAWEDDGTIPDVQLKSAFQSFEQMAAFIDAIMLEMNNSFEAQLEAVELATVANFIGQKVYAQTQATTQNGIHVVHLLQKYNTQMGTSLTAEQALTELNFYKFMSMQLSLYLSRMRHRSKLFNTDGYVRHTPSEYARILMLNEVARGAEVYLQSDTFHNELTALPNYAVVDYWQGSGQEWGYSEDSLVEITTSDGNTVKQDGVVALISDIEAMGVMVDNRRLRTSPPNGKGEYTNYFQKADMRYYNDFSENGIVFTVTDTPFTAAPEAAMLSTEARATRIKKA